MKPNCAECNIIFRCDNDGSAKYVKSKHDFTFYDCENSWCDRDNARIVRSECCSCPKRLCYNPKQKYCVDYERYCSDYAE